jgi:hypothetical protein
VLARSLALAQAQALACSQVLAQARALAQAPECKQQQQQQQQQQQEHKQVSSQRHISTRIEQENTIDALSHVVGAACINLFVVSVLCSRKHASSHSKQAPRWQHMQYIVHAAAVRA